MNYPYIRAWGIGIGLSKEVIERQVRYAESIDAPQDSFRVDSDGCTAVRDINPSLGGQFAALTQGYLLRTGAKIHRMNREEWDSYHEA